MALFVTMYTHVWNVFTTYKMMQLSFLKPNAFRH